MLHARDRLIIFTRYPVPGRTKTRLIPRLGVLGAAGLHQQLTEHVLRRLAGDPAIRARTTVQYTGGSRAQMRGWLGRDIDLAPQRGADLGQRMLAALAAARARGHARIVLVGSDCPGLDRAGLLQAFGLLNSHDLVIGPSRDGGYYLIGIAKDLAIPRLTPLFADIAWGSATVLDQTLALADRIGLRCGLLSPLHDIDRPEDLAHFHHHTCPR